MNYKEAFNKEPNIIRDILFKNIKDGLNDFVLKHRIIHSYFRSYNNNKLFVFLSAVGKNAKKPYPVFNRISWESKFEGNILCFDDPTRKEIDFAPCFYFGDINNNCLDEIYNIVINILNILNIKNEDVYFISSSNGGFASIYLANKIKYSTCIALCPQFDVDSYFGKNANIFYNKLNINRDDYIDRLNLYNILNNNESKFIIYSNIKNNSDKKQIDDFCLYNKLSYNEGINKIKNNFYLIIANINAIDTHLAQPDALFCNFIKDKIFDDSYNECVKSFISIYIEQMKKIYALELENKISQKIYKTLKNVSKINILDEFIDVFMDDDVHSYFRIRNYMNAKVAISFRVPNWKNISSIDKILEYTENNNFGIDYNDTLINIYNNKLVDFEDLSLYYKQILDRCFDIKYG